MDEDILDDEDELDIGEDMGEEGETGYREVEIREQDRYLPVANIARIMKKLLPVSTKVGKDAKESIQGCVSEFISFITSEASDKCQQEKRKTINGDDLLWAMGSLGFEKYVEPLKVYLAKYREAARGDKPEKKQYVRKDQSSSSSSSSAAPTPSKTAASFPARSTPGGVNSGVTPTPPGSVGTNPPQTGPTGTGNHSNAQGLQSKPGMQLNAPGGQSQGANMNMASGAPRGAVVGGQMQQMQHGRMNPMGTGQQQQQQIRGNMNPTQGMHPGMQQGSVRPGMPMNQQGMQPGMQRSIPGSGLGPGMGPAGQQGQMRGQMAPAGGNGMNSQVGSLISNIPNSGHLLNNGAMRGAPGPIPQIPSISSLPGPSAASGMLLPSVVNGGSAAVGVPMTLPSMSTLNWMNKGSSPTPTAGAGAAAGVGAGSAAGAAAAVGVGAASSHSGGASTATPSTAPTVSTNTAYVESKSEEVNKRQKI